MFDPKYIGNVSNAEIVENTGFEILNGDQAFIKRELILILSDGVKIPLANPEYLEFSNSNSGRTKLQNSGLDQKHIEAVILVWGNNPTVNDVK